MLRLLILCSSFQLILFRHPQHFTSYILGIIHRLIKIYWVYPWMWTSKWLRCGNILLLLIEDTISFIEIGKPKAKFMNKLSIYNLIMIGFIVTQHFDWSYPSIFPGLSCHCQLKIYADICSIIWFTLCIRKIGRWSRTQNLQVLYILWKYGKYFPPT